VNWLIGEFFVFSRPLFALPWAQRLDWLSNRADWPSCVWNWLFAWLSTTLQICSQCLYLCWHI